MIVNLIIAHSLSLTKEVSNFKFFFPKVIIMIAVWITVYCYVFGDAMNYVIVQLKSHDYLEDEK